MKILITGGSGLLGQYLNLAISANHNILTFYHSNIGNCADFNSSKIELLDTIELSRVFNDFKPDIIFHTAAISQPILPEGISPRDVYELNVTATKNIAKLCEKFNSKLIYTSTDLVYAGYRGSMMQN